MGYAIMRFSKIKSSGGISACQKHNERERETINANTEIENIVIHGDKDKTYLESFEEKTKDIKTIRKNAVMAIECFMSASPDCQFFKDRNKTIEWAKESIKWLENKFGVNNVIKSHLHLDEKTPHLHTFIIPIVEKNNKKQLSSYQFLGGNRKVLSEMQTDYHKTVEKFGLDRGLKGSKATHLNIKQFYKLVNETLEKELPKAKFLETSKNYRDRIMQEYQKLYAKYTDLELKNKSLEDRLKARIEFNKESKKLLTILYNDKGLKNFVLDQGNKDQIQQGKISIRDTLRQIDVNNKYTKFNKSNDMER